MFPEDFLERTFLGNTVESYLWFLGILLIGFVFKKYFSKVITRICYKLFRRYVKSVSIEKFLFLLTPPLSLFLMLITLYLAFEQLEFPGEWNMAPRNVFGWRLFAFKTFQVMIFVSVTWIIMRIVDFISLIFFASCFPNRFKA